MDHSPQAWSRSVNSKARAISGDAVRQGSSAAGSGARWRMTRDRGRWRPGAPDRADAAQFDSTSTRSISARRSTKSPACLRAPFQTKRPSAIERDRREEGHAGRDVAQAEPELGRGGEEILMRVARRLADRRPAPRPASSRPPADRARRWCPRSATGSTRPMSVRITRPLRQGGAPLHLGRVGAVEPLRHVLLAPADHRDARRGRRSSTIRSASPRRSRTVVVPARAARVSRLMTASGAIGAPSSAVAAGRALGVAPCPAARSSS